MADQEACIFSTIEQGNGVYYPTFDSVRQSDELWTGSTDFAVDGTIIPDRKDFEPSGDDPEIVAAGITVAYVYADETRITAADGANDYLVLWRLYADAPHTTSQQPGDNMTGAELSAILAYLTLNTPYTSLAITTWVINHFGVETQQEAVAWATARSRVVVVAKFLEAFRRWSVLKAELDLL